MLLKGVHQGAPWWEASAQKMLTTNLLCSLRIESHVLVGQRG